MAGEKLARALKDSKPKSGELSDLMFGIVTSTSPLRIQAESRMPLSSEHLILSRMVKNLTITITIDGKSGSAQVFRPLVVGDRVSMLRVSKGQKFYVLERV